MLLNEVRRRMRVKRYSLRTEQAYLYWIRRYIRTNAPRHPRELGGMALEQFLSDLAQKDRVAASTQNQALAALLFLYREVLALDLPWMDNVVRAKRMPRLPVVLSRTETSTLLRSMAGREALMAGLLYGSGLRPVSYTHLDVYKRQGHVPDRSAPAVRVSSSLAARSFGPCLPFPRAR